MDKKVKTSNHDFWSVTAQDKKSDTTVVRIRGYIGESYFTESTSARKFVDQIDQIATKNIIVYINSRGGSVVDGIEIFNALLRHDAHITTINMASAMSIAALILQAGDIRQCFGNAITMVHDASTGVYGNAKSHRDVADILDKYNKLLSVTYESQGVKKSDLENMLNGEDHYYTASEAKSIGLIDEITNDLAVAAYAGNESNLIPDHLSKELNCLEKKYTENSSMSGSKKTADNRSLLERVTALLSNSTTGEFKAISDNKLLDRITKIESSIEVITQSIENAQNFERTESIESAVEQLTKHVKEVKATAATSEVEKTILALTEKVTALSETVIALKTDLEKTPKGERRPNAEGGEEGDQFLAEY